MEKSRKAWTNNLKAVDELREFVRKSGNKVVRDRLENSSDRVGTLYRALRDSEGASGDDEIMSLTGMTPRQHQRAVSELKALLFDALLQLDLRKAGYDELGLRLYELERRRAQVWTLTLFRHGSAQYDAARDVLAEAVELEAWDVAVKMLSVLIQSAGHGHSAEDIDELVARREACNELQCAVDLGGAFFAKLLQRLNGSGSFENKAAVALANQAIESLQPISDKLRTFRLQEYILIFRGISARASFNHEQTLAVASSLERLMAGYPLFATKVRIGYTLDDRAYALLRLNRFEEARVLLEQGNDAFEVGSVAWFAHQDLAFSALLNLKRFEDALDLLLFVENTAGYNGLSAVTRDSWRLNRLIAEFFAARSLSIRFDIRKAKPGDVTRSLLTEFRSFKDDYTGHYFTAILLEVLLCLESSHGQMYLIDRLESLLKFRQRHLKDRQESQAYLFIEMLRLLVKHDFSRRKFLIEAASLHQRLLNPLPNDPTRNELVLPYEVLWDEVVQRLPEEPWLSD